MQLSLNIANFNQLNLITVLINKEKKILVYGMQKNVYWL
ncbi:hypothetical protein N480_18765 [Pseudoalteromonas luteoviolacea S2607]|uniref:Uncharacterized protein n=1 Tax=Pseudoalteromonas luteoviolacea S4060-1 TaxID=1365257 RepID=A0A167J062_9GAMM|nr:hypothetical protein N480_18765 [Pseudoalteromonas luteoviolacea S2607]KZN60328.1 hypothetical protein N478_07165 [Pseudoalteromonas luteoviolacea S4060-1]